MDDEKRQLEDELRQLRDEEFDDEAQYDEAPAFDPDKPTPSELDYDMWQKYLAVCEQQKVHPSIRDYVVWLDEQEQ